jgi:hypothetical protein
VNATPPPVAPRGPFPRQGSIPAGVKAIMGAQATPKVTEPMPYDPMTLKPQTTATGMGKTPKDQAALDLQDAHEREQYLSRRADELRPLDSMGAKNKLADIEGELAKVRKRKAKASTAYQKATEEETPAEGPSPAATETPKVEEPKHYTPIAPKGRPDVLATYEDASGYNREYRVEKDPISGTYNAVYDQTAGDGSKKVNTHETGFKTYNDAAKGIGAIMHRFGQHGHTNPPTVHDPVALKENETLAVKEKEQKEAQEKQEQETRAATEKAHRENWEAKSYLESLPVPAGKKATATVGGQEVSGTQIGPFLVHKTDGAKYYQLTHLGTGFKVDGRPMLNDAKQLAGLLSRVGNWNFGDPKSDVGSKTIKDALPLVAALRQGDHAKAREVIDNHTKPVAPAATETPVNVDAAVGHIESITADLPHLDIAGIRERFGPLSNLDKDTLLAVARRVGYNSLSGSRKQVADQLLSTLERKKASQVQTGMIPGPPSETSKGKETPKADEKTHYGGCVDPGGEG